MDTTGLREMKMNLINSYLKIAVLSLSFAALNSAVAELNPFVTGFNSLQSVSAQAPVLSTMKAGVSAGEQQAQAEIASMILRSLYLNSADLHYEKVKIDPRNNKHYYYTFLRSGIAVWGAELIAHVDSGDTLRSISGFCSSQYARKLLSYISMDSAETIGRFNTSSGVSIVPKKAVLVWLDTTVAWYCQTKNSTGQKGALFVNATSGLFMHCLESIGMQDVPVIYTADPLRTILEQTLQQCTSLQLGNLDPALLSAADTIQSVDMKISREMQWYLGSNLSFYFTGQTGALGVCYADFVGLIAERLCEIKSQKVASVDDRDRYWQIGEANSAPLRSFYDPRRFAQAATINDAARSSINDPAYLAGIPSNVLYMISEGVKLGVAGIGWEKTAYLAIYSMQYFSSTLMDFSSARSSWQQAAAFLGLPAAPIAAAWESVGVVETSDQKSMMQTSVSTGITGAFDAPLDGVSKVRILNGSPFERISGTHYFCRGTVGSCITGNSGGTRYQAVFW